MTEIFILKEFRAVILLEDNAHTCKVNINDRGFSLIYQAYKNKSYDTITKIIKTKN